MTSPTRCPLCGLVFHILQSLPADSGKCCSSHPCIPAQESITFCVSFICNSSCILQSKEALAAWLCCHSAGHFSLPLEKQQEDVYLRDILSPPYICSHKHTNTVWTDCEITWHYLLKRQTHKLWWRYWIWWTYVCTAGLENGGRCWDGVTAPSKRGCAVGSGCRHRPVPVLQLCAVHETPEQNQQLHVISHTFLFRSS